MRVNVFKSKIHRATVTHADMEYEGSVTVDRELLRRADILPYEAVHLWNVTRGTRVMTYALPGPRDSGAVCVNGAAAHQFIPGDVIIIATFADMELSKARSYTPTVVRVNEKNEIIEDTKTEKPGPVFLS